ncbi:MAG: hypothetical protein V1792_19560, partial [Pseudomonadota bacterium]
IVDRATKKEKRVVDTRIGTRHQVSDRIIADCLMTGEPMHYHWISPVLQFAEEHGEFLGRS